MCESDEQTIRLEAESKKRKKLKQLRVMEDDVNAFKEPKHNTYILE